ncbi:hypothetical protein [Bacillus sp. AK031]
MWRNERGFGTAESIVAVMSLFMIMLIFIPMMTGAISALERKESKVLAARVLYEYLEEELFTGTAETNSYYREGEEYRVNKDDQEEKICVSFKDYRKIDQSFCLETEVDE